MQGCMCEHLANGPVTAHGGYCAFRFDLYQEDLLG
jgi:hypothetical protein